MILRHKVQVLTKNETDGFVDGGLISEMRFQELRRKEVAEVSGLVPADVQVVNVDHPTKQR